MSNQPGPPEPDRPRDGTLIPDLTPSLPGASEVPLHNPLGPPERGAPHRSALNPPQQQDEIGRVGRYRVLRELGRGGMGIVYLAEDSQLRRQVAVKCLLPEVASRPGNRDRFEREARAMARIEHENVVPIFDIGESNGFPYFVMPLLRGETLGDRLTRDTRLSVAEVVRVGRELAAGLAALHGAGHVHRDVKPGNVWLEADTGRVKLLDFGLARPDDGSEAVSLSGQVMGTPGYMAPEQVTGDTLDYRADLFSLGCILYEAATGRQAFEGPNVLALLANLALQAPKAPTAINPGLPAELSALILAMIEKRPDRRPQSAQEVIERLAKLAPLPDVPFNAPPSGRGAVVNSSYPTVPTGVRDRQAAAPPASDPPFERQIPGWAAWVAGFACVALVAGVVFLTTRGDGTGTYGTSTAQTTADTGTGGVIGRTKTTAAGTDDTKKTTLLEQADADYRTALERLPSDPKAAAPLLRSAAERGHPAARYHYARLLLDGRNAVPVDRRRAIENVRKSAEAGHAPAAALLGHLISQESSADASRREARVWLDQALATLPDQAGRGDVEAAYAMGLVHLWGNGPQDLSQSVAWFHKAADAGHLDALYRLGRALDYGLGTGTRPPEAIRRYTDAALRGHVLAAVTLGLLECDGWGTSRNQEVGLGRIKAAAPDVRRLAEGDDAEAETVLGIMASEGHGTAQDDADAVRWFTQAAGRGSAVAANRLAGCYAGGRGVAEDQDEATRLYRVAADAGLPVAQYNLGHIHDRSRNADEAERWYRKAAEADLAPAQLALGLLLRKADRPDTSEAERWLKRAAASYRTAAEAGDVGSQFRMGQLYQRALGVAASDAEAAKWYRRAADQGDQRAKDALDQLPEK